MDELILKFIQEFIVPKIVKSLVMKTHTSWFQQFLKKAVSYQDNVLLELG